MWGQTYLLLLRELKLLATVVGHHTMGGVFYKIVSHLLLPVLIWGFLVAVALVSQLQFLLVSFRGNFSICSCTFELCLWEESRSRIFLLHYLQPEFLLWGSNGKFSVSHSFHFCYLEIHFKKKIHLHTSVGPVIFII